MSYSKEGKDLRIKAIRLDITRFSRSLDNDLKMTQQTYLDSLQIRIKRLAELYELEA